VAYEEESQCNLGGYVSAQEDAFAQCLGATGQITLQFRIGATLYPPTLSLSLSLSLTRANIFLFVNLSAYYMFFFFLSNYYNKL